MCVWAGFTAGRRWLNPAAAGQWSRPVLGSLGGCGGLGRAGSGNETRTAGSSLWLHVIAVHWRGRGPIMCSHDHWPRLWWHQQICDPPSWMGAPGAGQPSSASCHAVPRCAEPRCLALPAQTGSARALPTAEAALTAGAAAHELYLRIPTWTSGLSQGAGAQASCCASSSVCPAMAPTELASVAMWGLRLLGGRSW